MSREEMVAEFHERFKHPVLNEPTIPKERIKLRINLLFEELVELSQACGGTQLLQEAMENTLVKMMDGHVKDNENITECLDAFCDIQYVLSGAINEFGLQSVFSPALLEVHRSNMSKSCTTREEAMETVTKAFDEHGECDIEENPDGTFNVYRTSDRKTIKSINYTPARLKSFVE